MFAYNNIHIVNKLLYHIMACNVTKNYMLILICFVTKIHSNSIAQYHFSKSIVLFIFMLASIMCCCDSTVWFVACRWLRTVLLFESRFISRCSDYRRCRGLREHASSTHHPRWLAIFLFEKSISDVDYCWMFMHELLLLVYFVVFAWQLIWA